MPGFDGTRLRTERLRQDLTPEALAQKANVSAATVYALEAGYTGRTPAIDELTALADALGIDGDILLDSIRTRREEQGLPRHIEDPEIIAAAEAIITAGLPPEPPKR